MFGVSFLELTMIALAALVVVGPRKLPAMLASVSRWIRKIRSITAEVREQTGIDEILRSEGIQGGVEEFRDLLRTNVRGVRRQLPTYQTISEPEAPTGIEVDLSREYPPEGVDSAGAIPEDLLPTPIPEPELTPIGASQEDTPAADQVAND